MKQIENHPQMHMTKRKNKILTSMEQNFIYIFINQVLSVKIAHHIETRLWQMESEQATSMDSIKDVVRSSV